MSGINRIQKAILSLSGGAFQKLFDEYLYRKYKLTNIHPLGSHTGTDKTTRGTPDSFVKHEDGTFTLIMYGSVEADPFNKLKQDILSCLNKNKVKLEASEIKKIICAYASTNITPKQISDLENSIDGIEIDMIGLGTISHDLLTTYPIIARDHLNIPVDTGQLLIEKALDSIVSSDCWYINDMKISTVFPNIANQDSSIRLNQVEWIKNYINCYCENETKIRNMFLVIVSNFQQEKIEFFLDYLKNCDDVEKFKKLPMFPMSESWTGSQVPLIDSKIDFLEQLLAQIKGFDFIEHRAYLKEKINSQKIYRQSVEREEYLTDY